MPLPAVLSAPKTIQASVVELAESRIAICTYTAFTPAGTPNTEDKSINVLEVVLNESPSQEVEVFGVVSG